MGIIRYLLAFSVVVAHYQYFSTFRLIGGEIAVEGFFIISGFYIALILDGRYASIHNFLINRFLLLWPTYAVIASINLVINLLEPGSLANIFTFPKLLSGFLIFTNATMLFQDITMFLGLQNGQLHFVSNFLKSDPVLFPYLLIPQAWTLGLEFTFYLLAPLLFIKKYRYIFIIFIISLLIRIYLLQHGKAEDPWSYRFFPSELALFMLGAMAYTLYKKIQFQNNPELYRQLGLVLLTLVVGFIFFFRNMAANYEFEKGIFYLLLMASIPFIFYVTKDGKIDRFIGNLSYPIYLIWGLKLDLTPRIMAALGTQNQDIEGIIRYLLIVILAILIYLFIEKPLEPLRNRFKLN